MLLRPLLAFTVLLLGTFYAPAPLAARDSGAAQAHAEGIQIHQAWTRTTGSRAVSAAAYFTLTNGTAHDMVLTAAQSDVAEITDIHRSSEENGVMRMAPAGPLTLKPGETVAFKPGGLHVMLIRLHAPLKEGDSFPLTLAFENGASATTTVQVTGFDGPKAHP